MPRSLPSNVVPYKSTAVFDHSTVPRGLLRDHHTAQGVWAEITVLQGELLYEVHGEQPMTAVLTPGNPGVVEPQVPHRVELGADTRFFVTFYR